MKVYVVWWEGDGGEWDLESVWSTRELAEAEVSRLNGDDLEEYDFAAMEVNA